MITTIALVAASLVVGTLLGFAALWWELSHCDDTSEGLGGIPR